MHTPRFLYIIIFLLLVMNATTLFLVWRHQPPPPHRHPQDAGGLLSRELKLDATQQARFEELRKNFRIQRDSLRDAMRKKQEFYFQGLKQPQIGDSLLRERLEDLTACHQAEDLATFAHFQQLRNLCRPDQQERFDAVILEALRPPPPPPHGQHGPHGPHGPDGPPEGPPPPPELR